MLYFIHGLNGFASEWKPFITFFSKKGYECEAIELKEGLNLRRAHVQDYVAKVVSLVDRSDIVIGHSMGGLIMQKVAEQTTIKAGVGICPAPPQGINLKSVSVLSQIRYFPFIIARLPFLPSFSLARNRLFNDVSMKEAKRRYDLLEKQSSMVTYEVLKQKIPVDETMVTCPLFFIARGSDLMISPSIVQRIAEKYNAPMKTVPGGHYIFSDFERIAVEIFNVIKSLH